VLEARRHGVLMFKDRRGTWIQEREEITFSLPFVFFVVVVLPWPPADWVMPLHIEGRSSH
jgi:hypothetical protein